MAYASYIRSLDAASLAVVIVTDLVRVTIVPALELGSTPLGAFHLDFAFNTPRNSPH